MPRTVRKKKQSEEGAKRPVGRPRLPRDYYCCIQCEEPFTSKNRPRHGPAGAATLCAACWQRYYRLRQAAEAKKSDEADKREFDFQLGSRWQGALRILSEEGEVPSQSSSRDAAPSTTVPETPVIASVIPPSAQEQIPFERWKRAVEERIIRQEEELYKVREEIVRLRVSTGYNY